MLVLSVLFFLCVLILPQRRRQRFKDMVRVDQGEMEDLEGQEGMATSSGSASGKMDDNFVLRRKSEEDVDSGLGGSGEVGSGQD